MNAIDVFVAIYLLLGLKKGYKRGFCTELSAAIAWALILFTGSGLLHWVSASLSALLDIVPQISKFISFVVILVGTLIILFPLRSRFKKYIESKIDPDAHQRLGALMGLLRVSLVASLLVSILGLIPIEAMQRYILEGSYWGQLVTFLFIG